MGLEKIIGGIEHHEKAGGAKPKSWMDWSANGDIPTKTRAAVDKLLDLGMSQGEIAKELGISESLLSFAIGNGAGLGKKPSKRYGGLSSSEYILNETERLVNEKSPEE